MLYLPNISMRERPARRGVVLLVVIALLTLFAAVGLSFVYYAEAEAANSGITVRSQTQTIAGADPEMLLSFFLNQLIYDAEDKSETVSHNNVYSSLRGHSLARNMYGYDRYSLNVTPFNGVSRDSLAFKDANIGNDPSSPNVTKLINYQYQKGDGLVYFKSSDFVRDPGRYGSGAWKNRDAATFGPTFLNADPVAANTYVGANVPWTYADLNSLFLGQIKGDGEVLIQSFWRNWTGITSLTDPLAWRQYDSSVPFADHFDPTKVPPAWMKYATLRPLPWYNPGFPQPADGGGDVKNLDFAKGISNGAGGYYNNDSIWIDLGFPVRTAPNGKKYKVLFAPFIMDLDGKVNLNVVGNLRRQLNGNYEHGSNLGLGPWEINPNKVLPAADWRNVLHYRYHNAYVPGQSASAVNTTPGNAGWNLQGTPGRPPFYAFMDFDGVRDAASNYATSEPIYQPGNPSNAYNAANGKLVPFPYIPATSYGGGSSVERTTHPALYSPFSPNYLLTVANGGDGTNADDRLYNLHQMEGLYRYSATGSPMLSPDLFRLAPQNFATPVNRRLNVTLLSADLARPGITPWLDPTNPTFAYRLNAAMGLDKYPNFGGSAVAASVVPTSPNSGEYRNDYRGFSGIAPNAPANTPSTAKRLRVNRALANYPAPGNNGVIDMSLAANATAYTTATQERQQLARDIFDYLRFVTTGARPGAPITDVSGSPEFNALRWLAQLAVNIVDFRDIDEYNTAFTWYPAMGMTPAEIVYGTELPQVVVNEVYAEIVNDPMDTFNGNTMATMDYKVNFWIELLNPLLNAQTLDPSAPTYPGDPTNGVKANTATLQNANGAVYKLQIVQPQLGGSAIDVNDPANVLGVTNPMATVRLEVDDFTPAATDPFALDTAYHYAIRAVHTRTAATQLMKNDKMTMMKNYYDNDGFYVMGPQDFEFPPDAMATTNPVSVRVVQNNGMQKGLTYVKPVAMDPTMVANHSVILRRLACPHLPADLNPNNVTYNPYVTVDYLDNIPVRRGATYDSAAAIPVGNRDPLGTWATRARKQPYRASPLDASTTGASPLNSMFSHNNLGATFDWLVHLDRNFTSPMELLHVSGFRPFQLMQEFNGTHGHLAPWTKSEARIYRFLEYVDAGYRMAGVSQDGHVPGKININTIWDAEIFNALCDQNASVNFTAANVSTLFTNMLSSRTANSTSPGQADRPFRSLAAAHETGANDGKDATILRDGSTVGTPLFEVPLVAHPQQKIELLNKIFNNVTTRSNVFAVWVTAGFFEVNEVPVDPNPVAPNLNLGYRLALGKEIGKDENRHVRHRMFAIIDRTAVVMPKNLAQTLAPINPGVQTVNLVGNTLTSRLQWPADPSTVDFTLQPGMWVEVDTGVAGSQETVQITNVTTSPATITANFTKAHAAGTIFRVPADIAVDTQTTGVHGNPGPQQRFDHRKNPYLVPHYSIIQ